MSFNKKLINTLGQIEELSLKEVILNKKTLKAQRTEEFLNLSAQPENTCPFINDAKKHNGKIVKKVNEMINSFKYKAGRRYVEECDCCDSHNVILENKDTLYLMVDQMEDQIENISSIDEELEDLRNCCDDFREYGNDLKNLYWSYLDLEMTSQELNHDYQIQIKHRPQKWFKIKQFEQSYEKLVFKKFEFNPTHCIQNCNTSKLNYWLENAFDEYHSLKVNMPEEVEESVKNLQKIENWCADLENHIEETIKNPKKIIITSTQIDKYIEDLNEYQILKFENYLKKIGKDPIELFNWRKIVSKINLNNELACNEILVLDKAEKDINTFILKYNALSERYQSDPAKAKEEFLNFHKIITEVFYIAPNLCEPVKLRIQQLKDYFVHQISSVGPFTYQHHLPENL